MKEYYGEGSKIYGQTRGKQLLLMPALKRCLPTASKGAKLLDVGCGTGDLYSLVLEKGYHYCGIDISRDMISVARIRFPNTEFVVADACFLSQAHQDTYDVVLLTMLFPALDSKEDIIKILQECSKVLADDGKIFVSVTHPSFDHYMQKHLFKRDDIETNFKGYFHSGTPLVIHQTINEQPFIFNDFHWTMSDYISAIQAAGLYLQALDECPGVSKNMSEDDLLWATKRDSFPTYLVMTLGRL